MLLRLIVAVAVCFVVVLFVVEMVLLCDCCSVAVSLCLFGVFACCVCFAFAVWCSLFVCLY